MKKIIISLLLGCVTLTGVAQSTSPRWGNPPTQDNTGRVLTYIYTAPAFVSADTIKANAYSTVVKMGTLTAAQSVVGNVTLCHAGDNLKFMFTCDTLTAGRVVTFSTNFITSTSGGTITVKKSKKATISFIFDGAAWVETSRAVGY